jgi:hypothetical protein
MRLVYLTMGSRTTTVSKGILAAVGLAPAAVGAWAGHPVLSVLGLAGYEVLLFAGEIGQELRARWRTRLVERGDRWLVRRLSLFPRRYRDFVLGSLRFIDLKGLATIGFHTPELDEVFVDVSLAFRPAHDVSEGLLADLPVDVTDRHSLWDFLDRPRPVVLAVVGAAGSGKTTLLRHSARLICHNPRSRRRRVPILLQLRDHAEAVLAEPSTGLPELIRGVTGKHCGDEPPGWFEQRLQAGDCVVLLDGLDEVAEQEDRRRIADWVERQVEHYPKNDFVITSRPHGYRTANINGATVLQVRSFTPEQVRRFVHGWYLAVERYSTGAKEEDVRLRATQATDDLLERLDEASALHELTANPLLLTMIANVHRYRGALPGSRAELYGEICQVMLWRRHEAKKLPIELGGDKKELVLRSLAFTMMNRRIRDLRRAEVLTEIGRALRRVSRTLTAEEFLADVGSNGLLVERESGRYSYAHHTFQEYLAAAHVRDKGLVRMLTDTVDDVWWRETTLLYAAHSDADPIVRACLASGTVTALSLALDCTEQHSELAPELREALEELLDPATPPEEDPEHRRLRAAVLLTRHLRHQIGKVCARPITTGIYVLYRQDTGAPAPDALPARADDPIAGVRGGDAVEFTRWVNEIVVGEPVYRLPRRAELDDAAVRRALAPCAWLDGPELWVADELSHPHLVSAKTLAAHVRADIERTAPTLLRPLLLRLIPNDRVRSVGVSLMPSNLVGLAHDLAVEHDLVLDLADELNLQVDRDLDKALLHVLAPDFARVRALPLEQVTGRALAWAQTNALRAGTRAATWSAEVADAFTEETLVTDHATVVSPETLADKVCAARRELSELGGTPWACRAAQNLETESLPIFNRERPPDATSATTLRLASLCLAAEADAEGEFALGDTFREIAAGITLLQRRATGEARPAERIILATA